MAEYERSVFISYAWGGEREAIVNQIDETLQQRGIRIIRDKNVLGYKGSIKEFMERIGRGTCIIVVISDKYLRSPNCMFELVEIAENKQFYDRVFPVVLSDANIYEPLTRLEYVGHWESKLKELDKAMKKVSQQNLQGIRDDMDQYARIRDKISGITSILKDMNTLTPDMHRDSEFSNLYDAIVKRMEETATDVTAEFNEMAKQADRNEKVETERKAKDEADRLGTQKADEERVAKTKADRLDAQKAETDRLAQQKAEEERQATARVAVQPSQVVGVTPGKMKAEIISVAPEKKQGSKGLVIGIVAVVVLVIAGIGFSALSNKGRNSAATEAPVVAKPATEAPATEAPATEAPATEAPVVAKPATEAPATEAPVVAIPPTEVPVPKAFNFQACAEQCNGQNSSATFASGIQLIYIQFDYENFRPGSQFTRTWTNSIDGEWIKYSCAWDGALSGTEKVTLSIPGGVRSGKWEMTVTVDAVEVLKESINLSGSINYWFPQGLKDTCRRITS